MVALESPVPSAAPQGQKDLSLPLPLKDEEICLSTLPQEESYNPD